jgi:hypothetical protein
MKNSDPLPRMFPRNGCHPDRPREREREGERRERERERERRDRGRDPENDPARGALVSLRAPAWPRYLAARGVDMA